MDTSSKIVYSPSITRYLIVLLSNLNNFIMLIIILLITYYLI